jgi:cytochrome c biogenesis protein
VYELDTASLTPAVDENGERVKVLARPGETVDLPDGLGTLTLGDELPRYVALDLRHDPSLTFVLVFALLALGGLTVSLFTPRRRVWARAYVAQDGATVVEVAGLARGDDAGLQAEVDRALAAVPGLAEPAAASPAETSLDAPRQAQEPRVETGSEKD